MHTSYAWLTISQPWCYLPECSVLLVLLPLCSLQKASKADKSTKQINGVEGSKMQNKTFLHNFTDSFPQVYKIKFLPQKQYLKQVNPQDTLHGLAVLFNLYWPCVMTHTHTHTHTVQLAMCLSSCDRPQPEFNTRLRYSRGSIWTECFGFGSSSGVSSIQKRSLVHRTIVYKLDTCLLRFLCYPRQGSQHAVTVLGLSATTRHQKRGLFLWNLSQRENPRVASGGVTEEVWPSADGGGGMELAPRRQLLFWAWRLKKQICCVGGRNNKVALWMYYLNFKSTNHHILVQCDKHIKSNNPAYTCTSLRLRQHASIKVVCRVTATPVGQKCYNPKYEYQSL
jgi:hypothetical protein